MKIHAIVLMQEKIHAQELSDALTKELGALVTCASSLDELVALVKQNSSTNLVITSVVVNDNQCANKMVNLLYEDSRKIGLIVLGKFEHALKNFECVSEKWRIEEITRAIIKLLKISKEEIDEFKLPDFIAFPIKHFYLMSECPCDIYIKISKKDGDQFIKRLHTNDGFDKEALHKYEKMGLSEFFVEKKDRTVFLRALMAQSLSKVEDHQKPPEEIIDIYADAFEISSDMLLQSGINSSTVMMTNASIAAMNKEAGQSNELGKLLKKLLDDKLSFSYRKSFMMSLFIHRIIPKLDWGQGPQLQQIEEKLNFLSFFHDLYLPDENLQKILNRKDLDASQISPEERELVFQHANKVATLIQTYPKAPNGVDVLIRQHHGAAGGIGIPESLSTSISPLAMFFMVLETFVTLVITKKNFQEMENIISELHARFPLPTYRKYVVEIENLFKKHK